MREYAEYPSQWEQLTVQPTTLYDRLPNLQIETVQRNVKSLKKTHKKSKKKREREECILNHSIDSCN